MKDRAREILKTLISEIDDPYISNGPAGWRAAMDAIAMFKEEEHAIQKRSPEAEVPRAGEAGKDEARGPARVGKGNPKRTVARKSGPASADL